MNYKRRYNLLIAKANSESRKKRKLSDPKYVRYEKHHVLPRRMGGSDDESNLVLLTAREHFVAHWLLTKFTTGQDRYKCLEALTAFMFDKKGRKLNSWQMETARKANDIASSHRLSERNIELAKIGLHPAQSEASRELAAINLASYNKSDVGREARRQQGLEAAARQALWSQSETGKEQSKGRMQAVQEELLKQGRHTSQNAEHNKKFGELSAARNREVVACPYCSTTGGLGGMQARHFSNCKFNPKNKGLSQKQIWAGNKQ